MLYLYLALEQFTCDEEKIFWTLTFFKDGHAAKWSENLFHQEANTSIFPIQSWTDFEQQFRSQFFLVNAEADAINTLERSLYYQGNWTVDNYLDSFLILASDAGYTDPQTLVVKFCCGVTPQMNFPWKIIFDILYTNEFLIRVCSRALSILSECTTI